MPEDQAIGTLVAVAWRREQERYPTQEHTPAQTSQDVMAWLPECIDS